ncbi:MAG TPA: TolC family protein, partial [Thermodesulfobacteriota bacterium]|nr:TolC family protein [Thermodesulfobacteriota bacterium]
RAFSDLLIFQERVDLARQVAGLLTQLKDTAQELARAGAVPDLDMLRAEVERQRAATRLTLEETNLASARRNLNAIMGAPAGKPIRAGGLMLFEGFNENPDALRAKADTLRPDLKAAEASLEGAESALRLVRAERFVPSLTISASYSNGSEYDAFNQRGILGVSIPLPIVNRREGDVAAAEGAVKKGEAQRKQVLARIEKEVAGAYDQYTAAQKIVADFARRIVPGVEENAKLIQEGYRLGEFRLTDALLSQRDLFDARSAYLEAAAAYNRAVADLYWATGVRP